MPGGGPYALEGTVTRRQLRVVALADSLSLPRVDGLEDIRWEHTWPWLLQRMQPIESCDLEVINCGMRARTVDSLVKHSMTEDVVFKRPDVLVLQVGVVDCAPRIFSRTEKALLASRLCPSVVRDAVVGYRKARRRRITAAGPLRRVYTPPAAFRQYLELFFETLRGIGWPVRVLVLPILGHAQRLEEKSVGFASNIILYNEITRSICERNSSEWLPPETIETLGGDLFLKDGYHLSMAGHRAVAEAIAESLKTLGPLGAEASVLP